MQVASEQVERAIKAANRQADAARDAVILSEKTAQRQLRAYLSVGHGSISAGDTTASVEVRIHHAGTTPAYKIRLDAIIEVGTYLLNQTVLSDPVSPVMGGFPRYQYAIHYGPEYIRQIIALPPNSFEPVQLVKKSDFQRGP